MDLSTKKRLAAAVLAISGIAAFVAPFLLHSLPTQGGPGPGTTDNNNNNNDGKTAPPGGEQTVGRKKTLQDLKDKIADCADGGMQRSLEAKVDSAMRAGNSTRTDHHIRVLEHRLETPAVEKHAGSCVNELSSLIDELLTA